MKKIQAVVYTLELFMVYIKFWKPDAKQCFWFYTADAWISDHFHRTKVRVLFSLETSFCWDGTASETTFGQPWDIKTQQKPSKMHINDNNDMKNVSTFMHCGVTSVLPIHNQSGIDELYKTSKAVARLEISASAEKSS